jgi:hypothetical protein
MFRQFIATKTPPKFTGGSKMLIYLRPYPREHGENKIFGDGDPEGTLIDGDDLEQAVIDTQAILAGEKPPI